MISKKYQTFISVGEELEIFPWPYISWRRVRDLSMAAENTSVGFKMREKLRLESDIFSIS